MNTSIKIALLHLIIFATQALYMYLSNKGQFMKKRNLYVPALPFVLAFPVILSSQSPDAYDLYEYAIVICIFISAVSDVTFAVLDREYMTEVAFRRLLYAYFLICMAAAAGNGVSSWLRAIVVLALIGSFSVFNIRKKCSPAEIIKSLPLAISSYVCSWVFLYFIN